MTGVLLDLDAQSSLDEATQSNVQDRVRTAGCVAPLLAQTESIAPARFDRLGLALVHARLKSPNSPAASLAMPFADRGRVSSRTPTAALGADLVGVLRPSHVLEGADAGPRSRVQRLPLGSVLLAVSDFVRAPLVRGPIAPAQT